MNALFKESFMGRQQMEFNLSLGKHGGRRNGSGRKRIKSKAVGHRIREVVSSKTPLHLNFKFKTFIRNKIILKILKRALVNARKHGLRINQYSMQSNHIHLIVEAVDNKVLTKARRSLTVTFSKGINKGKIQVERYHLHVLNGLRETQNALRYVLLNENKHTQSKVLRVDGYSTLGCSGHDWVKKLIQKERLSLLWKPDRDLFHDRASSWLLKTSLHQLISP
jgi:REP element-mobilizing transposase RayT